MRTTRAPRRVTHVRRVCLAALIVLLALTGGHVSSQAGQAITAYQLVSEQKLTGGLSVFTYRATLRNTAGPLASATATGMAKPATGIALTDNTLTFGPVGSNATVVSTDTFAFVGKAKSKPTDIVWTIVSTANHAPVANAGPDVTAYVTQTAQLDGSRSTDQDGNPLTYRWTFTSRPAGSQATLSNTTAVKPTFVVDLPGRYDVQLVVNDGFVNSAPDTVTVTTLNSAPVANAGSNQTAFVTQTVTLNGSGSSDVDGDILRFSWTLVTRPPGSTAALTNATSVTPTFVVDKPGTYVARLVVNDGRVDSAPATVSITTQNSPPAANAGADQTVFVAATVTLDGSGSADVDGDALTYAWALISAPAGSLATLSDTQTVRPTFVVDKPGTYVAQLVVNDGAFSSTPDTVTISTQNSPPTASPGQNQTVVVQQLVLLDGSASSDVDGDPLTFRWAFTSVPPGSVATLAFANSPGPSFIVDRLGTYVVQLIVNDGFVDSAPATVTITTTNSVPTANAGTDQFAVPVGTPLTLDGTQSIDPDGQALTYSWSMIAKPAGSGASLSGSTTAFPSFVPDLPGDYVAQLIVNDGVVDSAPDTVLINATTGPPPSDFAPIVTANPADLTVMAGQTATFDAAATGAPTPTVQWQQSVDHGVTFNDVPGATSTTMTLPTTPADDDKQFRAVFSNTLGTATTTVAKLTVTVTAVDEPVSVTDDIVINGAPLLAPIVVGPTVDPLTPVTFTAVATDPADAGRLVFSLLNAPQGATINPLNGAFTWTPTEAQSANTYSFTVVVTDPGGLSATRSITITVRPVVHPIDEPVSVTDDIVITAAPLLAPIVVGPSVDPLTPVAFTAVATDPADAGHLIFSLLTPPTGAAIDPLSGAFTWTPTEAQSANTYSFTVVVTDPGGLTASRSLTITVRPVVHPVDEPVSVTDDVVITAAPLLAPIVVGPSVDPLTPVTFTAVATDPADAGHLVFSLLNAPTGATIDPLSGAFTWTPTEAQSASTYTFTVVVTDPGGLSATRGVTIAVRPVVHPVDEPVSVTDDVVINGAPMLGPLTDQTAHPARLLTFTATAVDPADALTLQFSLRNAPNGATIDSTTGVFTWTPTLAQSPGTYPFFVRVTDPGGLFDERGITVTVTNSGPAVTIDQAPGQADPTLVDPIAFNVTFSAPVTGFAADDVSLAGSTASGPLTASVSGSGASYTVIVSGMTTSGLVVASIPAGAAADVDGNLTSASTSTDNAVTFAAALVSPVITTQPTDQTVAVGETAIFFAAATGDPAPTIQWQVSTDQGVTFADVPNAIYPALGVPTTLDDNGHIYRAVFTNLGGAVATTAANLTVRLVVTNTNDSGPRSLRDAIEQANAHFGVSDVIVFDIPGGGPQTIVPISPLPVIVDPAIVDGTTQPGYTPSMPLIAIDGTSAGDNANGLIVVAGNTTIRGLVINRFGMGGSGPGGAGILIAGGGHNHVEATVIGIDPLTSNAAPNRGDGILIEASSDNEIGPGNVISFNGGAGVSITGSRNAIEESTISANDGAGIVVVGGAGNAIAWNRIFDNQGLGIDLVVTGATAADGVTANDDRDGDAGANDLQNFPVLTSALSGNGATIVRGTVNSTPNSLVRIHLFWNNTCDASGYGQGGSPFGVTSVTTDSSGNASFEFPLNFELPTGTAITATATQPAAGTSEFSACLPVNTTVGLTPVTLNLLTKDSRTLTVELSQPAGMNGALVNLTSTNSAVAAVPPTVLIASGATSAPVDVTSGTIAGTATIAATAAGFSAVASSDVAVSLRTMTVSSASPFVAVGRTIAGTVTLAQAAPPGGVTIALTSTDNAVALVSPASVTIAAGGLTASFTIAGVSEGRATVSASAAAFETATLSISSTTTALITLGSGVVAPGLDTSLALSIGIPAPAGGVTIDLTSSNSSVLTIVTPTVFIPEGLQIPAANPVVHGVAIGTAQVTATSPTLAPDTAPVTVTLSIAFSPDDLTVLESETSSIALTSSAPAPAGGLTFTTSSIDSTIATVPASVQIEEGTTSVQVPVTGVAIGTTAIRASASGITEATASVTVRAAPPINITGVTVGKDLQVTTTGMLGAPAPAGNLQVTITSLDPTNVRLATSDAAVGSTSITVQVDAGASAIPAFYVQALGGTGSVQLRMTAPRYATSTTTVNLTPSGFSFPRGTQNFLTSTFSGNTPLNVIAARLSPADLTVVEAQPLRGGLSVDVPIASSDPSVGRLVDTQNNQIVVDHLTFNATDSLQGVAFDPRQGGTTIISVGTPAGFSTPTELRQITATVSAPPINISNTTVGQNLQVLLNGALGAPAPAGNAQVTVTSLDPAKVLLSTDGEVAGSASVTLDVGAGQGTIPSFYVQALTGTGTAQLRTTAQGYNSATTTITLTPSGFSFPPGTVDITTTSFSTDTSLSVIPVRLNPANLSVAAPGTIRGGFSARVSIASSDPTVGVLVDNATNQLPISYVDFANGDTSAAFAFDPIGGGTTTIALTVPAGFATPSELQHIDARVSAPPINMSNGTIGKDLQISMSGSLGAPAPAGNVQVTVTSQDPAKVLLATTPIAAGATSITMEIAAGQGGIPAFYVQALDGVGTAQLRMTAPGYSAATSTITLTPSGFSFPIGTGNFTTTTFSGNTTKSVVPVSLNPTTLDPVVAQTLRGGLTADVVVPISSSEPNVGTIAGGSGASISDVTFKAGDTSHSFTFNPAAGGTTTISITPPAGFSTPHTYRTIDATVTAPNINLSTSNIQVGLDLQASVTINLGAVPPSRLKVTVTSHSGTIATVTADPAVAGGSTVTFDNVPATMPGTLVGSLYIQGRALGSTTITVQAPGYNDATITVTVHPSGFSFVLGSPSTFTTTTFSGNQTFNVNPVRLDPTTLNVAGAQPLRGGYPDVSVSVTSSNPGVGTIVNSPLTFSSGTSFRGIQFDPVSGGTTTITLATPAGFTTPSNLKQIAATVTAPNINVSVGSALVGLDLQIPVTITFGAAPPTQRNVTVTSNNQTIATVTADPKAAGGSTLTFPNAPSSGTTVGTMYVQGRMLGGVTTITVHADGYNDATVTVTVHPSAFSFAAAVPTAITTTTFSTNSSFSVTPMRLDPTTLNAAAQQTLRGGYPDVSVTATSSDPAVGTIVNSPLTFSSNDGPKSIQFDPANAGSTTISLSTPTGFSTPSNQKQIAATVTAPNIVFSVGSPVLVGLDLQVSENILFAVSPPTRRDVTVTVNDPSIAVVSANSTAAGGSSLILSQVPLTLPNSLAGTIYIQGLARGTTTIRVQAPGYNDATLTVTVHPSGFAFAPGTPASVTTTTTAANRTFTVNPVRLDPTFLNVAAQQSLRGGHADVSVDVTSSSPAVGTIVNSPAIFHGGDSSDTVQFDPATVGTTIITVSPPATFSTPSNLRQVTANVTP